MFTALTNEKNTTALCWISGLLSATLLLSVPFVSGYGAKLSLLGVGAGAAFTGRHYSERERKLAYTRMRLEDVRNQMLTQSVFDSSGESGFNIPTTGRNAIQLFEITDLINKRDRYPHVMVVGGTGAGKTTLVEWLIDQDTDTKNTYVCSAMEGDEFVDYERIGDNFNYAEIAEFFKYINYEWVNERKSVKGKKNILDLCGFRNIVLDESRDACQNAGMTDYLTRFISMIRKWQVRIWLLGVSSTVKSLNIEGEGEIRDCLTYVRIGDHAKEHFNSLVREGTYDLKYQRAVEKFINQAGLNRFCMVDNKICFLPDLSNYRSTKKHVKREPTWKPIPPSDAPAPEPETRKTVWETELAQLDRRKLFGLFSAWEAEGHSMSRCLHLAGFKGQARYHNLGKPIWNEYQNWKDAITTTRDENRLS